MNNVLTMFEQWPNPGAALGVRVLDSQYRSCEPERGKAAMSEENVKTKSESRKPDTEAEGLAWCLALYRKIQRKRRGLEVRRADHR